MQLALLLLLWILPVGWPFIFPIPSVDSVLPDVLAAIDEVRSAYLPNNVDTAIAVGVAEAISGAVGGLASRGTANALGDKKIDSLQTKLQTTSAFFGTRGLLRVTGRMLGVPRPLTLVAAAVLGSVASEATKRAGRTADRGRQKRRKDASEKAKQQVAEVVEETAGAVEEDTAAEDPPLSAAEIAGDIMKWLSYDLLFQATAAKVQYPWEVPLSFASGGAAAVIGLLVFDLIEKARMNKVLAETWTSADNISNSELKGQQQQRQQRQSKHVKDIPDAARNTAPPLLRGTSSQLEYEQTAIEGAILFGIFQLVYDFLNKYLPEGARYEFPFYKALGAIEDDLLSELHYSSLYLAQHMSHTQF